MRKVKVIRNGRTEEFQVHGDYISLPKGMTAEDFMKAQIGMEVFYPENHYEGGDFIDVEATFIPNGTP
jgi:hypothetical protein